MTNNTNKQEAAEEENENTIATRNAMSASANLHESLKPAGMRQPEQNEQVTLKDALTIFHDDLGEPLKFKLVNKEAFQDNKDEGLKTAPVLQAEQGGKLYTIGFPPEISKVTIQFAQTKPQEEVRAEHNRKVEQKLKEQERASKQETQKVDTSKSVHEEKQSSVKAANEESPSRGRPSGGSSGQSSKK